MFECLNIFAVVLFQYKAHISDLAHRTLEKLQDSDTYFSGTEYTAENVFNTFYSDGPVPLNYLEFLDVYSQHKPNIALETDLFMLQEEFREKMDMFKSSRALIDQEIARLLHEGVDYNFCDDQGNNLLIVAAAAGSKSIIEHILVQDSRPDINASNQAGEDAFIVALKYGHYDVALFLLQQNACPK
ncbi:MAG: ankyrin repeat domain-containing protein, partial [Candidatus Babeliales bacterium]